MVVEGGEFQNYTLEEKMEKVESTRVMARSCPVNKRLPVQSLRQRGHVAAVTGDDTYDLHC